MCCAAADLEPTGLRVLGVGEAVSRGVRKGAVVEIDRAAEAVAEAVDMAEQMSGVPIDSAVVGIAGGHITSQNSRGVVAVASGHREVRDQDVHAAEHSCVHARVDDTASKRDPPAERRRIAVLKNGKR